MTSATSTLRKNITSLLVLTGALVMAGSNTVNAAGESVSTFLEVGSTSVAAAGEWQRPAPVIWSSRAQSRWSARFVTAPKYVV